MDSFRSSRQEKKEEYTKKKKAAKPHQFGAAADLSGL